MKRYPFILMELMVALSLLGIILGFFLSSVVQHRRLDDKLAKRTGIVMKRARVQERLSKIVKSSLKDNGISIKGEDEGVEFSFDNKFDPDPSFCGIIKGCLRKKESGELLLTLVGKERKREEILLSHIKSLCCELLVFDGDTLRLSKPSKNEDCLYLKIDITDEKNEKKEYLFFVP